MRTPGDVRGETNDAARARASVPDAQQPSGQAIVIGIGGDGRRLAPCSHRARSTGTGDGPWHYRRRSPTRRNRPLSTRLRITLRRTWGARVSSACSAHRRGRFAAAAAAPSSRRCGWITPGSTGKRAASRNSLPPHRAMLSALENNPSIHGRAAVEKVFYSTSIRAIAKVEHLQLPPDTWSGRQHFPGE